MLRFLIPVVVTFSVVVGYHFGRDEGVTIGYDAATVAYDAAIDERRVACPSACQDVFTEPAELEVCLNVCRVVWQP